MSVSVCERFPSISPFQIRREKAREVFLLVRRLQKYNAYEAAHTNKEGKRIIRRKAGDNWF